MTTEHGQSTSAFRRVRAGAQEWKPRFRVVCTNSEGVRLRFSRHATVAHALVTTRLLARLGVNAEVERVEDHDR
jgi:hypothetical protein